MALLWNRTCGTRAFRPNSLTFAYCVWRRRRFDEWRGVIRKYCSQTSAELSIRESRKTLDRPIIPKIKRGPFAKDLFVGKFDKDVLAFPEILESQQIENINALAQNTRAIVDNSRKSAEEAGTNNEEIVSPFVLQRFKDLGYFGLEIPEEYDGAGMTATEAIRLSESWGIDLSLSLVLNTHQSVAAHAILKSGSENLKKKFLTVLASGEKIAAFCLTEECSGSDISTIQSKTKAVENVEGNYLLNGTKTWVTNGGLADVFLVIAYINELTSMGETEPKLTAILVDRERQGVRTEPTGSTLGVRGVNVSTVHFKDTPVSNDDIVGKIGDGLSIAINVMTNNRFTIGGNVTGLLKELTRIVTEHCINRRTFDLQLMDHELIQKKISKMVCTTYAVESIAYLTAGLLDSTQDPDFQLEAAMAKVYCSEGLWQCASDAIQILGAEGYKQGIVEKWLRDARALSLVDGSNEILKMYIALIGINHAGAAFAETVMKLRHPLFHPQFMMKRVVQVYRDHHNMLKLDLDLCGYLHLSLKESSDLMEYCVKKFAGIVENVLHRHGADVLTAQIDLDRLACMAIEIFCMAAVLSRASRSYCIGLRNETHELTVATMICRESHAKFERCVSEIDKGTRLSNDVNHKKTAKITFRDKGYSLISPITRNW